MATREVITVLDVTNPGAWSVNGLSYDTTMADKVTLVANVNVGAGDENTNEVSVQVQSVTVAGGSVSYASYTPVLNSVALSGSGTSSGHVGVLLVLERD